MQNLIESIKERGVITPAAARQKEDGRYELVSGYRRKQECELAGLTTLRCEVVEPTKEEAAILMVKSDFQRSEISPPEKAFSYKMRLEAMNRQGPRMNLTSSPLGWKLAGKDSAELIDNTTGDSKLQVRHYIRLTYLVPKLLEMADEVRISPQTP